MSFPLHIFVRFISSFSKVRVLNSGLYFKCQLFVFIWLWENYFSQRKRYQANFEFLAIFPETLGFFCPNCQTVNALLSKVVCESTRSDDFPKTKAKQNVHNNWTEKIIGDYMTRTYQEGLCNISFKRYCIIVFQRTSMIATADALGNNNLCSISRMQNACQVWLKISLTPLATGLGFYFYFFHFFSISFSMVVIMHVSIDSTGYRDN